jgi:hypothetical protein
MEKNNFFAGAAKLFSEFTARRLSLFCFHDGVEVSEGI